MAAKAKQAAVSPVPPADPAKRTWIRIIFDHSGFRYLVVGGASFIIDFGLLALLFQVFDWPLWLATGTAFLTSFVFSYFMQRAFSFSSESPHASTLAKYLTLLAFNTLATIGIVALVDLTGWGWGAGKISATVITTAWNYFAYRYWVFSAPTGRRTSPASAG
ncbi:GtrA family protein [Cryobacterium zhongshanensis]|uniref:GtrA family protein n=1 Tax=Cryobacterium zhongshanensis TaxID=2928153 RepID=A0AA41UFB3_9MICO|nr:GtrA family protein [Cryobacterium zhongshanensis]MCI4658403.1 GtrA family protein [Cryobacterium zhongshanensis]